MAGNKDGAAKAKATNQQRYGKDFYAKIGAMGGKKGKTGGFASMDHEQIVEIGRKGGTISRKGKYSSSFDQEAYLRRVRAYAMKNQAKAQGEA